MATVCYRFLILTCPFVLQWLDSHQIVQSLVSLLDPVIDKQRHYNVSELLCDFIKVSHIERNCTERNEPELLFPTLKS